MQVREPRIRHRRVIVHSEKSVNDEYGHAKPGFAFSQELGFAYLFSIEDEVSATKLEHLCSVF